MSIAAAWPKCLAFFGMALVIEPSPGKLSGDARQPPAESDDDGGFPCNPLLYSRVLRDGQGEAGVLSDYQLAS
jgi:hypothetical protein